MAEKIPLELSDHSEETLAPGDEHYDELDDFLGSKRGVELGAPESVVGTSRRSFEPPLRIERTPQGHICLKTAGYIGKIVEPLKKKNDFLVARIGYRFGEALLESMIGRIMGVDDYYVTISHKAQEQDAKDLLVMLLLCQQFVLNVERAAVLGVPQNYRRVEYHDTTLRGQVDVARFIQKDIPFLGKISSVRYERREIQEIVDLLDCAFGVVERFNRKLVNARVWGVRNYLKDMASGRYPNRRTIEKAMRHKTLNNPLYARYKDAALVASWLIRGFEDIKGGSVGMVSPLFDVSLLWENYLYALIKERVRKDPETSGWKVLHEPELSVYESCFFARKMKPDIVLLDESGKKVLVLDAKSKRMTCRGGSKYDMGDLDREDFFQMHTYMSYYEKQGYTVLGGGLVYPMEKACENGKKMACDWFGGNEGDFFVEGVVLSGVQAVEDEAKKVVNLFCPEGECEKHGKKFGGRAGIPKEGLSRIIDYCNRCKTFDVRNCENGGCDQGEPCLDEERLENMLFARLKEKPGDKYFNNNGKNGDGYRNRLLIKEAVYAIAKCKQAKKIESAEEKFFEQIKEKLTDNKKENP